MKSFLRYLKETDISNEVPFYSYAAIRHKKTGHILTGQQHYYAIKKAIVHHDISWMMGVSDHPNDASKLGWGKSYNADDWEEGFLTQNNNFENRDQAEKRFGKGHRTSEVLSAAGHLPLLDKKSADSEIENYESNPSAPILLKNKVESPG